MFQKCIQNFAGNKNYFLGIPRNGENRIILSIIVVKNILFHIIVTNHSKGFSKPAHILINKLMIQI